MSTVSVTNLKHESASGNNITLDSNGRVGVNNATPGYQVDIVRSGGGTDVARVKGNAGNAFVRFEDDNASAHFSVGADDNGPSGSGSFVIYDRNATAYRWMMDSAGRVTMPYQPAFHAVSTSVKTITGSAFIFDSAYFNIGGHYNTSNGRFTAPVSGIYFLEMSFLTSNTNTNNVDLRFFKNGVQTQIATTYHVNYTGGNHRKGHMIGMASLTANDYITVQTQSSSSNGDLYGDNNEGGGKGHTCFRGYLIG